jgi:hypothetical protein
MRNCPKSEKSEGLNMATFLWQGKGVRAVQYADCPVLFMVAGVPNFRMKVSVKFRCVV